VYIVIILLLLLLLEEAEEQEEEEQEEAYQPKSERERKGLLAHEWYQPR